MDIVEIFEYRDIIIELIFRINIINKTNLGKYNEEYLEDIK